MSTVIVLSIQTDKWAPSSEFVSSSIPSWQNLTAHAQPFRGARDLAFCLKVPLNSLLLWASSGGSGETARIRRLAWTFAACIGDKYQIRLTGPKCRPKSNSRTDKEGIWELFQMKKYGGLWRQSTIFLWGWLGLVVFHSSGWLSFVKM